MSISIREGPWVFPSAQRVRPLFVSPAGPRPPLSFANLLVFLEATFHPEFAATVFAGEQVAPVRFHVFREMMLELEFLVADGAAEGAQAEGQHDVAVAFRLDREPLSAQAAEFFPVWGGHQLYGSVNSLGLKGLGDDLVAVKVHGFGDGEGSRFGGAVEFPWDAERNVGR